MAGLALFDQSFARLGIPGLPVYASEVVLATGVLFLLTRRHPLRGVRTGRWFAPTLLVLFVGWGLVKLLASLHYPVMAVIRDSALVYYALFAVVVIGLSGYDRRFHPRAMLELYGRFVPWLLLIAPIRILAAVVLFEQGPLIPGTDVYLLSGHRLGNLAVNVALATVFLASSGRNNRATVAGIVAGVIMIIVMGTQSRGGVVAAVVAITLALVVWNRWIRLRLGWVLAIGAALFVLAWGLNLHIPAGTRDISVTQLGANFSAIVGGGSSGAEAQASATIDFREDLWSAVLADTIRTGQLENGWGFGPNLGVDYLPSHVDSALRNPHNSHMTVIARLGLVGLALWIGLWVSWFYGVLSRARRAVRTRLLARDHAGRLALLAAVGCSGMLVNAYFDPTLETPMVATWLWALFGFGLIAVSGRLVGASPGRDEPAIAPTGA
ncbi:MAG TPA: O-antigen ligase family protein [Acidimicrobiales bacterium]